MKFSKLDNSIHYALYVLGKAMWLVMVILSAPIWIPVGAMIVYSQYDNDERPWDETP